MKRQFPFFYLFLILVAGFAIYVFAVNYYIEKKAYRDAWILWNDKEAFIFVGREINGFVGSRASFIIGSLMPMHSLGTDCSSDLIVIHFDGNGYTVYDQTGVQHAGNPFIYHGNLYFEHDINEGESLVVWKWMGTTFAKVEANEAHKILKSFKLFDDLLNKEGWKESEIYFVASGTNISLSCQLASYELTFRRIDTGPEEEEQIMLQNGTAKDKKIELLSITREMRKVTKNEYLRELPAAANRNR